MYTEVQLQSETSRNVLTPLVMSSSDLCGFCFVEYSVIIWRSPWKGSAFEARLIDLSSVVCITSSKYLLDRFQL